jgi:N-acetylglucosaminyldiphosphoundecaprenol N-acetyl-beta-D-mannosaminyltransferase
MEKYFKVNLEFDKKKVDQIIQNTISDGGKGYVCSVEGNILATANTNSQYLEIVNNALVNICDGSSIAMLASLIHKQKFKTYIGADLFINYIKTARFKSFFLGNTEDVLIGLKSNLSQYDSSIHNMKFQTLPFKHVDEFDYSGIAQMINENNPDIIWVSLGAPKQEIFMSKLQPYLNRGVMFGFGAIFNFYSNIGGNKRAPYLFLKLNMEWLYRMLTEQKRIRIRAFNYLKLIPKIIIQEIRKNETTRP